MATISDFPNSASLEEQDEDISALEYARLNGLARNHLIDSSPTAILNALREIGNDGLTDDSNLEQLKFPPNYNMHERLTVSKDGARLLAWAMHPELDKMADYIVPSMLGTSYLKHIRLELPLLSSDHEADVKKFANRETFEPHLKEVRLPLEVLDIEKNEGLTFSSILWNLGAKTLEELKKEKISVTRESVEYIQGTTRSDWTDIEENELWRSLQKYNRVSMQHYSARKLL